MAHFAELNESNIVKRVIVVHNNELLDENGNESEQKGIDFCVAHYGGTWIQTSYNNNFRKWFAGIGSIYNPISDVFYPAQPFASWTLDEDSCTWVPPISYPVTHSPDEEAFWLEPRYQWNEETLAWEIYE